MNETIERMIAFRSKVITCSHCGVSQTRNHPGRGIGGYTDVQRMYTDGERYYGSPLSSRMGSVIVDGDSCGGCVRKQAQDKVRVLSATYVPASMIREPRVNEMA
jgi:hypothetical protein